MAFGLCATSCNDFLDEKPTSNIFPDVYFSDASHLEAYANNLYVDFCLLIRLRQIMGYMEKIKIPIIKPQEVQVAVTHWIAGWFHSRIRRMDIILIISVNVTTFWNKSYLSMKQEPSEEMRWMLSNI